MRSSTQISSSIGPGLRALLLGMLGAACSSPDPDAGTSSGTTGTVPADSGAMGSSSTTSTPSAGAEGSVGTTMTTTRGGSVGTTTGAAAGGAGTTVSTSSAAAGGADTTVTTTSAGGGEADTTSASTGGGEVDTTSTTVGGSDASGGAGGVTDASTSVGGESSSGGASGATTSDADASSNGGTTGETTTTGGGGTGGDTGSCPTALEGFATLNAMGQNGTYGGRDGETVTVTTQAELDQYATASEPYTIRVQGAITISPKGTEIRVASNKTIVGVGSTGEIVEGGFFLAEGVHNVIIRNLVVRDTFVEGDWEGKTQDFDGVQMDTAHHVWIDHCHFHHLGDGIIDSRKDTTYLTVSWNILSDHNKAFGIGWTDNVTAEMTIHHNWFRDLNQRNPSIDNVLRAHLYNNFLQRIDSYGNYARGATNLILENSVFDTVNDPHYGDTGSLVATGNIYRNTTGQQETFGSAFFNPSDYYDYTLDPADQVEDLLAECAGPRPELGQ